MSLFGKGKRDKTASRDPESSLITGEQGAGEQGDALVPVPHGSQASPRPKHPRLEELKNVHSLDELLDFMVSLPDSHIDRSIEKMLAANPEISTQAMMDKFSKRYVKISAVASASVGGGAAIPGSGLAVGAALTGGELAAFATNTALYVLTMARLAGIPTENRAMRKALVLSAILGDDAGAIVADQVGIGLWNWARNQVGAAASPTLGSVNKALASYANKKLAAKMSGHVVGRFIPLGIGAAIGYFSGRKLALNTVEGVHFQLSQLRN